MPTPLRRYAVRARERMAALLVAVVSLAIPRDPARWVFGSMGGRRFADNAKHLFLATAAAQSAGTSPIRATWLTADGALAATLCAEGFDARVWWTLRGLWAALRAGAVVTDSRAYDAAPLGLWRPGGGARLINCWHGIPLKQIEHDIQQPAHPLARAWRGRWWERLTARLLHPQYFERPDVVLTTGRALVPRLAGAFHVPVSAVVPLGQPRNDALLDPVAADRALISPVERAVDAAWRAARARGERVFCYMPTFRDAAVRHAADGGVVEGLPLPWEHLDAACRAHRVHFVCKLHPADVVGVPAHVPRLTPAAVASGGARPGVAVLPADCDVYPLLRHVDVLVTDYSSVAFDFLLLDRPLLYYVYDLAAYTRDSRGLYEPFGEAAPGRWVRTPAGLLDAVVDMARPVGSDQYAAARAALRDRLYDAPDAGASERALAHLAGTTGATAWRAASDSRTLRP